MLNKIVFYKIDNIYGSLFSDNLTDCDAVKIAHAFPSVYSSFNTKNSGQRIGVYIASSDYNDENEFLCMNNGYELDYSKKLSNMDRLMHKCLYDYLINGIRDSLYILTEMLSITLECKESDISKLFLGIKCSPSVDSLKDLLERNKEVTYERTKVFLCYEDEPVGNNLFSVAIKDTLHSIQMSDIVYKGTKFNCVLAETDIDLLNWLDKHISYSEEANLYGVMASNNGVFYRKYNGSYVIFEEKELSYKATVKLLDDCYSNSLAELLDCLSVQTNAEIAKLYSSDN